LTGLEEPGGTKVVADLPSESWLISMMPLFLIILRLASEILLRSLPRIRGLLQIACIPKRILGLSYNRLSNGKLGAETIGQKLIQVAWTTRARLSPSSEGAYLERFLIFLRFLFSLRILFFLHLALIVPDVWKAGDQE